MSNLYRNIDSGQLKGIGELLVLEEKAIKYWNNLTDNFRGEKKILLRDENTVSIEVHWDISSVKKKTLHTEVSRWSVTPGMNQKLRQRP